MAGGAGRLKHNENGRHCDPESIREKQSVVSMDAETLTVLSFSFFDRMGGSLYPFFLSRSKERRSPHELLKKRKNLRRIKKQRKTLTNCMAPPNLSGYTLLTQFSYLLHGAGVYAPLLSTDYFHYYHRRYFLFCSVKA
jgi:hypothetical protein